MFDIGTHVKILIYFIKLEMMMNIYLVYPNIHRLLNFFITKYT
jgi:hypothetical protein